MPINYHSNNTTDTGEFIISHSMLCKLDPLMGGHPKIFYKALTEPSEEKATFNNGNILHHWMEHKDSYVTSDLTKPGESGSGWAETFHELYNKEGWKSNAIFMNVNSHSPEVKKDLIPTYSELFQKINKRPFQNEEEFVTFIALVRFSRTVAEYNKALLEPTMLAHFDKLTDYIGFLKQATGRVILTNAERDTLMNCQQALRDHPVANMFMDMEGEVEKELFWNAKVFDDSSNAVGSLRRKAKLDKFIVDHDKKTGYILDWKTSNFPAATFADKNVGAYWKYRNGRQLTSYDLGLACCEDRYHEYNFTLVNVVVQTNDEFPVIIYETGPLLHYQFRREIGELETRAYHHITTNQWNITKEEEKNNSILITN